MVDDEVLSGAVRAAYLPALLVALAHALDDLSLLRPEFRPDPARVQDPSAGLSPEQRAAARELAIDHLRLLADRTEEGVPATDDGTLRTLFGFLTGRDVSDDYLALLHEELGLSGDDPRAPGWHKDELDAGRAFSVVVIGAGMSGLACAHRLRQAGVPFVVIEKNDDVGGTWFENRYPGCRVDVPNHLYSYSFHQRRDWPQRFTPQGMLLDYFRQTADAFGLREHIRFGTEVTSATYDDANAVWQVHVRSRDGREEVLTANVVVSAVGQLNRPKLPDIAGRERFRGAAFHSARWDPAVDLKGARVAVIGTAASGFQLIPPIAEQAAELHIYQRTPNWFAPTRGYHEDTPEGMQWLLDNVPTYSEWYRLSLFWRQYDGMLGAATPGPANDLLREFLTGYLEDQFADLPEVLPHVVPSYPPLAKRILLDDGIWAATLRRDNVELVADPIDEITEDGVVAGGRLRPVDVIVYATGFCASEFLMPMRVIGRDGLDLHQHWGGDARAYLGLTIPGFPNLFCMYGPNTNLVANGSIIYLSECEVQYVLSAIELLLRRRARSLEVRADVHDNYNRDVDAANDRMVWGATHVHTWYRNAHGRIAQNWPYTLLEFWQRTHAVNPDDYVVVD